MPLVFNDLIAILVAFVAAFVLRAIFLDKLTRFWGIRHGIGTAPLGMLYLAWFVLVYVLVARRYGLY
ncbi:MAG: hypothetical protein WA426_02370, partial [Silvibacterium sp.]